MRLAGVKPPPKKRAVRKASGPAGPSAMTADEQALLASLPERPLPKIISRDEYLAQRSPEGD